MSKDMALFVYNIGVDHHLYSTQSGWEISNHFGQYMLYLKSVWIPKLLRRQYSFVNFQSLITIMDELQVCFAEQ